MIPLVQIILFNVTLFFFFCLSLRSFTSLCYSADGESVLAGGQAKFVCIYNIKEQMLIKKFEISCNLSFDAMEVRPHSLLSEFISMSHDCSIHI